MATITPITPDTFVRPAIHTGIVDTYSGDGEWDLTEARAAGVVALVHKATEGQTYRDSVFDHAMRCAQLAGLLRGAYHYGNGRSGGADQAEKFLAAARPHGDDVLLCLDLEGRLDDHDHDGVPDDPGTMSTAEARAFIERVYQRTGRWPMLYAGASKLRRRMRETDKRTREVLSNAPLWLAAYGPDPAVYDAPAPWASWFLMQYSDGKPKFGPRDQRTYPRSTPGFHRCDRSAFRGDVDQLAAAWSTVGR